MFTRGTIWSLTHGPLVFIWAHLSRRASRAGEPTGAAAAEGAAEAAAEADEAAAEGWGPPGWPPGGRARGAKAHTQTIRIHPAIFGSNGRVGPRVDLLKQKLTEEMESGSILENIYPC